MASEQMGMPAAAPSPEEMAVFDQMRQNISPKEFSDEMLAGAEQVDPQAVSEFRQELDGLDMPPEVLDALNDLVDEILANPERYDEIRQQYIAQGIPEDFLPEQFDPQFFAALNMAIDQMVGAPAGPQAFAKGGIAELKPIAKALAGYGRNGDTMLAHITPAEARMLKRRGGSGTINPKTGLPEFFLGKIFKSVGKALKKVGSAVKKFASSTVGRLVTTVALGFFLGPAAAHMLGATSAAGVAAVSGFVGSAGSTLLAGGNLRDALKAGAVGGLTAGAGAGLMGGAEAFQAGSYAGPTTVGGQFERLKSAFSPTPLQQAVAAGPAPVPEVPGAFIEPGSGPMGVPQAPVGPLDATAAEGALAKPSAAPGGIADQFKGYLDKINPSKIQEAGAAQASQAGIDAMEALRARLPNATPAMLESAYQSAFKAATPGVVATYGPMAAVGIGALGAAGGFKSKPAPMTPEAQMMRDRLQREEQMMRDNPSMFTPKGFERFGAQYNEKGQITGWSPWTPASAGAFQQYYSPLRFTQFAPPQVPPSSFPPPQMIAPSPPPGFAEGGIASLADGGSAAYEWWKSQGKTPDEYYGYLTQKLNEMPNMSREQIDAAKQQYGISNEDVAEAMRRAGMSQAAQWNVLSGPQGMAGMNTAIREAASRALETPGYSRDIAEKQMRMYGISEQDVQRATGMGLADLFPAATVAAPYVPPVPSTPFEMPSTLPAPTVIPALPAAAVPEAPPPVPLNVSPDFQRYVQATYGTPIRPTWSVLGNYAQGAQDPFGAAKRTPIYNQMAQAPIRMPLSPSMTMDSSINFPIFQAPPVQQLPTMGTGWYPEVPPPGMATGGIAGLEKGGYPRRNGQIDGPGTETSDSIPAMLSDGEFVMTAKAVRGAGNGSRREGAKKMYALMHRLEKNAARG